MALKKAIYSEKRCKIQGGGQEMAVMVQCRLMVKILTMTIQVNFVPLGIRCSITVVLTALLKVHLTDLLEYLNLLQKFSMHIIYFLL